MAAVGIGFPVILRRVGTHMGQSALKVDDGTALRAQASGFARQWCYVIQFVDTAIGGRFFRRFRFFYIDGRPFPSNLHFSDQWNVHGGRRRALMKEHPWMEREESAFVAEPAAVIGQRHVDALGQLPPILGLDVFGVDFAVDAADRLWVFEANAAMSFVLERLAGFPHLERSYAAIAAAVNRMVLDRLRPAAST